MLRVRAGLREGGHIIEMWRGTHLPNTGFEFVKPTLDDMFRAGESIRGAQTMEFPRFPGPSIDAKGSIES